MKKNKKICNIKIFFYILSIGLLCFVSGGAIFASSVNMSEIMYDVDGSDTDREWIEIYNGTGNDIVLTDYFFTEANIDHKISAHNGIDVLKSSQYAVIVQSVEKFKNDNPNYGGLIFDSSFSLVNEGGELLAIKDKDKNILFQYTYDTNIGAKGDGKTLQFNNNAWVALEKTPGAQPVATSSSGTGANTSAGGSTGGTASSGGGSIYLPSVQNTKTYAKEPEMLFTINAPSSAIVGDTVQIKSVLYGFSGEIVYFGNFTYNFGDGQSIKTTTNNNSVSHVYHFPGEYTISVSYTHPYVYNSKPIALGKKFITVVASPLQITEIYTQNFNGIRVYNDLNDEFDISGYTARNSAATITLPENSYIGPKKSIVIFLPFVPDTGTVLLHKSGYIAASFSDPSSKKEQTETQSVTNTEKQNSTSTAPSAGNVAIARITPTEDLGSGADARAVVLDAQTGENFIDLSNEPLDTPLYSAALNSEGKPLIFYVLILLSLSSFLSMIYFIFLYTRKNNNSTDTVLDNSDADLYTLQEEK